MVEEKARAQIEDLLRSMYDQMIIWNSTGMPKNISLRKYLGLSAPDFVAFNTNPESWAERHVNNMRGQK